MKVLVTGASGYVATHVVKVLQDEGYQVVGTVRSLQNKEKVGELQSLAPNAKHPLELVEADLTSAAAWKSHSFNARYLARRKTRRTAIQPSEIEVWKSEVHHGAVEGCTHVIHTASPFPEPGKITDPENQLMKPAEEGTRTVMNACIQAGTVKRVVLTSSCAAIFGANQPEKALYTEADWTDPNSKETHDYYKSKALAEKEAWKIVKENPGKIELAVINPVFVLGPILTSGVKGSTSVQILRQIVERDYPVFPHLAHAICDVRDVAKAHYKAMILPEILHKELSPYGYNPTTSGMPKAVAWMGSWFSEQFAFLYPRWGSDPVYSTKRMKEVLGIKPTPMETSMTEMAYSLIDRNIIKQTDKYKESKGN